MGRGYAARKDAEASNHERYNAVTLQLVCHNGSLYFTFYIQQTPACKSFVLVLRVLAHPLLQHAPRHAPECCYNGAAYLLYTCVAGRRPQIRSV